MQPDLIVLVGLYIEVIFGVEHNSVYISHVAPTAVIFIQYENRISCFFIWIYIIEHPDSPLTFSSKNNPQVTNTSTFWH